MNKGHLILLLIIPVLTMIFLSIPVGAQLQSTERYFNVTARQFAYEPGRIVVNQGDIVTIKLKSADVTHGFYIAELGINETVSFGEEKVITFVADKVGTFKIRCSVTCGPLHPFMVGELVVEQNGLNVVFIGSTALIILVGVLSFALVSRRRVKVGQ